MERNRKFYYTRTYYFRASKGRRKWYMCHLVEDDGSYTVFNLLHKGTTETVRGVMVMDGDIETVVFDWNNVRITLRADMYCSKGYPFNDVNKTLFNDQVKDVYLDSIYNRQELMESPEVFCLACENFMEPDAIKEFTDEGQTGICPHCGKEALYPIPRNYKNEWLFPLIHTAHKRFFM